MDHGFSPPFPSWGVLKFLTGGSVHLDENLSRWLGFAGIQEFPTWEAFVQFHKPQFTAPWQDQELPFTQSILDCAGQRVSLRFYPQWDGGQRFFWVEFGVTSGEPDLGFFDQAPAAMILVSLMDSKILRVNPPARVWFQPGRPLQGIQDFGQFFAQDYQREDFFQALGRNGRFEAQEVLIPGNHWLLLSAGLLDFQGRKTILAEFVSIDAQKESERVLKGYNSFLEALLSGTPDPVFYSDRQGAIAGMNKAFMELTGYGRGHWIGQDFMAFLPPEDRNLRMQDLFEKAPRWRSAYELDYRAFEGQEIRRFLISRGVFQGTDGRPEGMVFILKDITRLKETEENLRQAMERAEAASLAKSAFLANMSHEIRTPLNIILGFSEILSSAGLDQAHQDYIQNIRTSGKNLLLLINDILDLSKIEAGKMQLTLENVDLAKVIGEVIQIFSLKAKQIGLKLRTELFFPTDLLFKLDEVRIRQILFNLVGNAVKFTSQGEVVLSGRAVLQNSGLWNLYFTVKDTGIGISDEVQGTLFESFQQADGPAAKKFGGTGLGLSITRRLVEMMQGNIRVSSVLGQGSEFSFEIPGVEALKKVVSDLNTPKTQIQFQGARVMIVEDNAVNRLVVKEILRQHNLTLVEIADGPSALDFLSTQKVDLILMDIRMEKMDGVETAQKISKSPGCQGIPMIALTALTSPEDQARIQSGGFSQILFKPVDPKNLVEILSRFLPHQEVVLETKPGTEGDVGIQFSEAGIQDLAPWTLELVQKFAAHSEEVRRSKNIARIKSLALELEAWGQEHGLEFFQKWAQALVQEIQSFQLKIVDERLAALGQLIQVLKERSHA